MFSRSRAALALAALTAAAVGLVSVPTADAAPGFNLTRLSGANRFGTAAAIAQQTFGSAPTVLIARADLFPDALAGSYLAGSTGTGAPILLSRTDALPAETAAAITALNANKAIILGGPAAIGPAVEAQLRAMNLTVERLGGANRYDTAKLVAENRGAANVGSIDTIKTAMVGSGVNFPDALAGGPLSYDGKLPTLLTRPDVLPAETRAALTSLGIKGVLLLGGPAAVGTGVEGAIAAMGITVVRVSGADRQATAVALAGVANDKLGFSKAHVNLARGDDFADALAFGPHAGKEKAAMILTGNPNALTSTTSQYLTNNSATLGAGHVAGGPSAVSDAVVQEAVTAGLGQPAAATFTIAAGSELREVSTTRSCTASVTNGRTAALMLLPTANVTSVNGEIRFADDDGTNKQADEDAVTARITKVNGTATNAQKVGSTTSTGTITFDITSSASEDVTVVVFDNPTDGGNGVLDLEGPAAANTDSKPAAEDSGVGCRTIFTPSEAAVGASVPTVDDALIDLDAFTSMAGATYFYDDNDTFRFGGQPLTKTQFEGVLSSGDIITVSYAPEPAGTSTFDITTDNLDGPASVSATAMNLDGDPTVNDVRVTFADPGNGPGTTYKVQRGTVTVFGGNAVCGGGDDTAPLTFADRSAVTLAADPVTGDMVGKFDDMDVPNGCYQYRVVATNTATAGTDNTTSGSVTVPGTADATAPTIVDVRANDAGEANRLGLGDTVRFIFSEPLAATAAASGANFEVKDADNTTPTPNITCGAVHTCSLNAAQVTISAVPYAAGRVLTVTLGAVTNTGGDNVLNFPATVLGVSAGFEDMSGNNVDLVGSADVTIEKDPAFPPAT